MPSQVCMGAQMQCCFGSAPAVLAVVRPTKVAGTMPMANIQDNKPLVNIPTFGTCMTPTNPAVASATAAALGVLTPAPCVPATSAPWLPIFPHVMVDNQPTLVQGTVCMCSYGGVIQFTNAGQVVIDVTMSGPPTGGGGGGGAGAPPDVDALIAEANAASEEKMAEIEEELEQKKQMYAAMSKEELEEAIASGTLEEADLTLAQQELDSRD